MGFLVVGGEFDVFLTFLVFHPEFVVRPGADDVPCVPIGGDVVGMGAVVHDAGDIRAVGVALSEMWSKWSNGSPGHNRFFCS